MAAATPAARARERLKAVTTPPVPPPRNRRRDLNQLKIVANGQPYLIGPAVEGDPAIDATKDSAETIAIQVRDPAGKLQKALADEKVLLAGAVTMNLDGIMYTLRDCEGDDTSLVTLTFEDQVAWRLRQFSSHLAVKRSNATRAEFIAILVDEAARPPFAPMRFFCPESDDSQRIAAA
jgi:hypothetical protein